MVDKRFTESDEAQISSSEVSPAKAEIRYATITAFIGDYLRATVTGIGQVYDQVIGNNATSIGWAGSGSDQGFFGSGFWVDSDYTQGLSDSLLENFVKIFTYKAIK